MADKLHVVSHEARIEAARISADLQRKLARLERIEAECDDLVRSITSEIELAQKVQPRKGQG